METTLDEQVLHEVDLYSGGGRNYTKGITPELIAHSLNKPEDKITSSLERLRKEGKVTELGGSYSFPSKLSTYKKAERILDVVKKYHPDGVSPDKLPVELDDLTRGEIFDGTRFLESQDIIQKVEVYNPTLRQSQLKYKLVTKKDRILRAKSRKLN